MSSKVKSKGQPLEYIFEPYVTGAKASVVNIKSMGTDLSDIYAPYTSRLSTVTTYLRSTGTDINRVFQKISGWVTNITGSATDDRAQSCALDSEENVYTAGIFQSPILTFNNFEADPLATGSTISTSVAGTMSSFATTNCFLAKYNKLGKLQWATQISGQRGNEPYVTVDILNNVYVSCDFTNVTSLRQISNFEAISSGVISTSIYANNGLNQNCIVKYTSSGKALWAATVNLPILSGQNGNIFHMKTYSSTSLYITGFTRGTTTFNSYSTISSTTLVTSSFGSLSFTGNYESFVAKYNSNGAAQWGVSIASLITSGAEFGRGITTDSQGNVYASGGYETNSTIIYDYSSVSGGNINLSFKAYLQNPTSGSPYLIKYNPDGQIQWATNISSNSFGQGFGVECDTNDNVVMVGYLRGTSSYINSYSSISNSTVITNMQCILVKANIATSGALGDTFVAKYSSTGQALWATCIRTIDTPGAQTYISTDSYDNIFLPTPYIAGSGSDAGTGGRIFSFSSINTNSTINLQLFGQLANSGNYDMCLVKYNSSGVCQYGTRLAGTLADYTSGIATTSNGTSYITGIYNTSPLSTFTYSTISGINILTPLYGILPNSGGNDICIAKYNPIGLI